MVRSSFHLASRYRQRDSRQLVVPFALPGIAAWASFAYMWFQLGNAEGMRLGLGIIAVPFIACLASLCLWYAGISLTRQAPLRDRVLVALFDASFPVYLGSALLLSL